MLYTLMFPYMTKTVSVKRQTDRERQTDRQTDKQTVRQTDRKTDRDRIRKYYFSRTVVTVQ